MFDVNNSYLIVQENGKIYSGRFANMRIERTFGPDLIAETKVEGTLFELKEISKYTPFDLNEEDIMNILTEE